MCLVRCPETPAGGRGEGQSSALLPESSEPGADVLTGVIADNTGHVSPKWKGPRIHWLWGKSSTPPYFHSDLIRQTGNKRGRRKSGRRNELCRPSS